MSSANPSLKLFVAFWSILLLPPACQRAENQSYTVSYAGLPVVNVSIQTETDGKKWSGEYRAWVKKGLRLFYSVDNSYHITAVPEIWLPLRYNKAVHEGDREYTQEYLYNPTKQTETFPNGIQVSAPDSMYNLFSAMLWVQHHPWKVGEEREIAVEVDGQVWRVQLHSSGEETLHYNGRDIKTKKIPVTFLRREGNNLFQGRSDILSKDLPATGRKLIFWVDTSARVIYQIRALMKPFSLWAKRN